ncbi:LacI family DNA-binding transcriptional regulator [Microbacterium betulae]|uniref:LacI family DNA-binding transcriptional regulator n=1 Tax=Microbacterium betulae TaxID=2981139 RepID=A0AA97I6R2_9MICO|nr:LacI family DNA-binding transcriptional regulator [Microbacterium sp. AB]WOF23427.1 LacI family DNA-binding transcriptional regulator [Microbacterium sp. AB]
MATIADVATLAGVSKATASRAFSRPEMVSPATAQRVRDAAGKLGFVVNNTARLLAGGRTGVIALVVPTLDNSFFTPIIGGAQARADAAGFQLTVVVHPLERTGELAAFERLSRQVDGFIVVAPRGTDDLVVTAGGSKPSVLVDREIDGVTSVVADTASAFGSLAERFVRDGHERLVYVGGPEGSWQDAQRTAAVRAAAEALGARLGVVGPHPSTFAAGVAAAADVRRHDPTAVIPYATAIGLGIQYAYLADGAKPPVVSSERAIVEALGLRGVPAIDVDGQELGRLAAELVIARIADPATPPAQSRLVVPVDWGA